MIPASYLLLLFAQGHAFDSQLKPLPSVLALDEGESYMVRGHRYGVCFLQALPEPALRAAESRQVSLLGSFRTRDTLPTAEKLKSHRDEVHNEAPGYNFVTDVHTDRDRRWRDLLAGLCEEEKDGVRQLRRLVEGRIEWHWARMTEY